MAGTRTPLRERPASRVTRRPVSPSRPRPRSNPPRAPRLRLPAVSLGPRGRRALLLSSAAAVLTMILVALGPSALDAALSLIGVMVFPAMGGFAFAAWRIRRGGQHGLRGTWHRWLG